MNVAKRFGIGTLRPKLGGENEGVLREAKDIGYIQHTNNFRVGSSMGIVDLCGQVLLRMNTSPIGELEKFCRVLGTGNVNRK